MSKGARRYVVCLGELEGMLCISGYIVCLSGGWEVRCVSGVCLGGGARRYVVCLRGTRRCVVSLGARRV